MPYICAYRPRPAGGPTAQHRPLDIRERHFNPRGTRVPRPRYAILRHGSTAFQPSGHAGAPTLSSIFFFIFVRISTLGARGCPDDSIITIIDIFDTFQPSGHAGAPTTLNRQYHTREAFQPSGHAGAPTARKTYNKMHMRHFNPRGTRVPRLFSPLLLAGFP